MLLIYFLFISCLYFFNIITGKQSYFYVNRPAISNDAEI